MFVVIQLLVRHALTAFGVFLMNEGYADAGQVELITGALLTIAGVAWSIVEKKLQGKFK